MLHDPLIADRAEAVRGFPAQQQHNSDQESRGTEPNPDCGRADMHVLIIGNDGDDCKHSRILRQSSVEPPVRES